MMNISRFRRSTKSLNHITALSYSVNPKYVNQAKGGQTNFYKDFTECHIETTPFQKFLLGMGSGLMSIADPRRGDMVAVMGESTGELAFESIRSKMLQSEEGKEILEDKPRISSGSVDLEKLKQLPEGTLGKAYSNFLEKYKYSPDERLAVRFVDDIELAYVAQRYREAHDLFHTLLDMPTNMLGEVTVKWVEAIQTKLPMCVTGALFGPLRLAPKRFTRNYYTKPVLKMDPDVNEDLTINGMKPLPEKIEDKTIILPDNIESKIISLLKHYKVMGLCKDLSVYKKQLYLMSLPIEGARRLQMLESYKNSIVPKIFSRADGSNIDSCVENVNKLCEKYDIQLNKLSNRIVFDINSSLLYMAARAPYEYSAVLKVFKVINMKDKDFKPKSLFDFGSGVGTVIWAASKLWRSSITECYAVDVSPSMNSLAQSIIEPVNEAPLVKGYKNTQFLPSTDPDCDIVVASFTFMHLKNYEERMKMLNYLWNKTGVYLVIIENGTKDGFQVITEVRDAILNHTKSQGFRSHVVAPCPHDLSCPRTRGGKRESCYFLAKYRNLKIKTRTDVLEGCPYSYVVLMKESRNKDDKQWPRVVEDVTPRNGHVHCTFCTAEGKLENLVIAKSKYPKLTYKCARRLRLGDTFPGSVMQEVCESSSDSDQNDSQD